MINFTLRRQSPPETAGEYLRQLRIKRKIKIYEMAERVNCRPSFVSMIETGKKFPSIEMAIDMLAALEPSRDEYTEFMRLVKEDLFRRWTKEMVSIPATEHKPSTFEYKGYRNHRITRS